MSTQARQLAGVVTGGGAGIGAACVRKLVELDHLVAIADESLESAQRLAAELGPNTVAIHGDVSSEADCQRMVDEVLNAFGRCDFAVNNAGTGNVDSSLLADIPASEWRRLMSVNLDGMFYALKAEVPAMRKGGGSIVNISSVMGEVATTGAGAYVASKHAVVGLTKAAALDYAPVGIRVNTVGPGYIKTPMLSGRSSGDLAEIGARHPLNRLGRPEEIASLVAFLVSEDSSFITGAYYAADGGYSAR